MREKWLLLLLFIFSTISYADTVLIGKWKGTYYGCGQGVPTNAEIDVYDNLSAVFRFYASNSNLGAFDGIFPGTLKRNGAAIEFIPATSGIAAWFIKPNGSWISIGFSATLDQNNLAMSGKVTGAGCTNIELTKASSGACEASYSNANLHIPCVKVKDQLNGDKTYDVNMKWLPSLTPMTFELTGAKVK